MLKKAVLLGLSVLLCACAGVKSLPADARGYHRPGFFKEGETLAAFKVTARFKDQYWRGVLRVKKVDADGYSVLALGDGAYKLLEAVLTPQGIAWKYIYPDGDKAVIRSRAEQFLNLLLLEPEGFTRLSRTKTGVTLSYKGAGAAWRYTYAGDNTWPESAQTVTALNSAEMRYGQYTPFGDSGAPVPHVLVYKDGALTLEMTLISLK